jgi:predicted RNA-binding Zn-ribbon protein involved in translation (DUF1610 family)
VNIVALMIALALLFLTLPYVASPFIDERRRKKTSSKPADPVENFHREDIFIALRDLDFDYQTGKVIQEDYDNLRIHLMIQAATFVHDPTLDQPAKPADDDPLEALIKARKKTLALSPQCTHCDAPLHPQDKYCPACGQSTGVHCPSCGKSLVVDDRFCSSCGTPLQG